MTTRRQEHGRIIIDPQIMTGKPVVKGTRIPIELVLRRLAQDLDLDALFQDYPRLTEEDVKACIEYAGAVIGGEDLFPLPSSERRRAPRKAS